MEKQELVVMTKAELEELVERVSYKAANKATSSLFRGLEMRYLGQFESDIRFILSELEALRRVEY